MLDLSLKLYAFQFLRARLSSATRHQAQAALQAQILATVFNELVEINFICVQPFEFQGDFPAA